ncbi:hypothetical protein M8P87_16410 [Pseudomonas stutzeri]|jgi:carbamate kinase|uniref:hypothetical protein n=1 Tax=Stutzerimonas stutzeri TaxID=316 RepID=UPI00210CAF9D|nr:hypothetical protein [Stutzerimonas stutzeri]MCQ4231431.1 hypothetical protein [Stutzerimonas stutzeri]
MLKKITLAIVIIALISGLIIQYGYIKRLQATYKNLQIEYGHARAIDAYHRTLTQVDEKGSDYAKRALVIGMFYEAVRLEQWQKENNIQLAAKTSELLGKVNSYKPKD